MKTKKEKNYYYFWHGKYYFIFLFWTQDDNFDLAYVTWIWDNDEITLALGFIVVVKVGQNSQIIETILSFITWKYPFLSLRNLKTKMVQMI